MRLRVNGKPIELPKPTALIDYLNSLGVDPRAVAVEVNEKILVRSEFEASGYYFGFSFSAAELMQ